MRWSIGVIACVALVAGCTAKAKPKAKAEAGTLGCAEVFDCSAKCKDEACTDGCLARAAPGEQPKAEAVASCITTSGCGGDDETCLRGKCGAQLTACAGVGGADRDRGALPTVPTPELVGAWATSASQGSLTYGQSFMGSARRQYVLAADGRFAFHAEYYFGDKAPDRWLVVDQAGRYTVDGDQLTIQPLLATAAVRDRGGAAVESVPIERETTTYRWQLHLFEGLGETQLVLTPPAKTERDGEFAANDAFPGSYLLSPKYNPEWQFPP